MRGTDPQPERGVAGLRSGSASAQQPHICSYAFAARGRRLRPAGSLECGGISEIAPLRGAGTLLAFGSRRHWRGPIVAWGAIAIVVISGMLEVLVLALRSAFTCAPRNCRPRVARRHGGCLIDHRWCRGDGVRRGKHSARCYSAVSADGGRDPLSNNCLDGRAGLRRCQGGTAPRLEGAARATTAPGRPGAAVDCGAWG